MRTEPAPPADYQELEDLRLRVQAGRGPIDLARYSPITRLRVMPITGAGAEQAWVRHLRAFLDPVQLPRTLRDASDLALGALAGLPDDLWAALEKQEVAWP
jgi:hypothetical protein